MSRTKPGTKMENKERHKPRRRRSHRLNFLPKQGSLKQKALPSQAEAEAHGTIKAKSLQKASSRARPQPKLTEPAEAKNFRRPQPQRKPSRTQRSAEQLPSTPFSNPALPTLPKHEQRKVPFLFLFRPPPAPGVTHDSWPRAPSPAQPRVGGSLPASQSLDYRSLDSDSLNTLRTQLGHVKLVIIDEISMVGNKMLNFIHKRLQEITGSSQVFGGISIIVVGDFFQLRPVCDSYIFANIDKDYGPLATNLWQTHFQMFELHEIMRQRDDLQFAQLLNRLREGRQTPADLQLLRTRCPKDSVFGEMSSVSSVCSRRFNQVLDDPRKTMQLHTNLQLALGLRYDLCVNVNVEDGLTNGAACVVTRFALPQSSSNTASGVAEVVRTQFPLRPAAAKTIHRSQGDTLDKLVIDLDGRKMRRIHYVGLSHVKSLDQLYILNLNEDKIRLSKDVQQHMET
uniref:ATP-dependent DNA helicase n=1 Tax=Eptatretus burgeri TaxID=7764 RepID=A0A8C4NJN1_EPTBU